jgi:hypothetical protein
MVHMSDQDRTTEDPFRLKVWHPLRKFDDLFEQRLQQYLADYRDKHFREMATHYNHLRKHATWPGSHPRYRFRTWVFQTMHRVISVLERRLHRRF